MQTTTSKDTPKALADWAATRDSGAPADAKRLNLLTTRAAVAPTKDSYALAASLSNFFTTLEPLCGPRCGTKDKDALAVLSGYIADTRQPAWARLAAALFADDAAAAAELASAAPALSDLDGLAAVLTGRDAFSVLHPVARTLLVSTHKVNLGGFRRHLTPGDLAIVLSDPNVSDFVDLARQVDWTGLAVDAALDVIDAPDAMDLWDRRAMLCEWASSTKALDAPTPATINALCDALTVGPRTERGFSTPPRSITRFAIATSLSDRKFETLAADLVARNTPGSLRLLGVVLSCRHLPTRPVLLAAASSPESSWSLARNCRYSSPGVDTVIELIHRVTGSLNHDEFVVIELLAGLFTHYRGQVSALNAGDLGSNSDLVPAAVAKVLARSYGYMLTHNEGEYVAELPAWVTSRIMTLRAGEVHGLIAAYRGGDQPDLDTTLDVARTFSIDDDELDRARAVLYELDYAPIVQKVPHLATRLVETLRSGLLDEARHPGDASITVRNTAWLRCLSAPDALRLVRQSALFNASCKASTSLVPSVVSFLNEVVAAAGPPQGQACVVAALTDETSMATLPASHTLIGYANAIAQVVTHQSD